MTSILGKVLLFDHLLVSHCVSDNPNCTCKWPSKEQQNIYILYELPCLTKEVIKTLTDGKKKKLTTKY